jgi:hypothetical protein
VTLEEKVRDRIEGGWSWPFLVHTDGGMLHDHMAVESVYRKLVAQGVKPLDHNSEEYKRRNARGARCLLQTCLDTLRR